ncbi:P-loop containing nucleoside triphosphate hydrolase [Pseudocohnilembus persalinus]|uniref:p-loop containing nucleoside triphosphate hydrolase n=1 Tax=Pseudocohnilembus persalinus TaxID=266149 RepID=A0A0V0QV50_PSEPJ|nr:P-loop containing nucleoside triphosphate hydrolase [Pseudocohnilembus persalinus]|eukprot:KRX05981.1 P-loop containing nucleoside triphosphate hydrolase [Pseudocohnilembus persalinus]
MKQKHRSKEKSFCFWVIKRISNKFVQIQKKQCLFQNQFNNFKGRSNVGKSSIINSLFQAQAAFTSKYPGKTRHLCFFRVSNQDQNLILCDAPGYGFAKRTKSEMQSWGEMMGLYISKSLFLHRVYVIIDASVGFIEVDKMVFKMLEQKQRPFQIVFSKHQESVWHKPIKTMPGLYNE